MGKTLAMVDSAAVPPTGGRVLALDLGSSSVRAAVLAGQCLDPVPPGPARRPVRLVQRADGPADPAGYHARTGAWWHPLYWPARLRWLAGTGARAHRWQGLPEYLTERLLGEAGASVWAASGTGALDTVHCGWDAEALALAGVPERAVPPLLPRGWTGRLLPAVRPPLAGPCGNRLGRAGGRRGGQRHRQWVPRAGAGVGDHRYVGRRAAGGTRRGLVALPDQAGHRPPHEPRGAGGAVLGLRLSTRAVDLAAAVLEGLCHEVAGGARAVDPTGRGVPVLSGGAVRASPWLARRLAAALPPGAVLAQAPEIALRGAAMLATGWYPAPGLEPVAVTEAERAAMAAGERHRAARRALG